MSNQETLLKQAQTLNREAAFDQAVQLLESQDLEAMNSTELYAELAHSHHELKQFEKALEYYEKVIDLAPAHAFAHNNLGMIHTDLKDYKKALMHYDKAIAARPDYDGAYYNRALTHYQLEQYEQALSDYQKKVALTSEQPDFHTSTARSRIAEITKLIGNQEYKAIKEQVQKIKDLLLYTGETVTHYTGLSSARALIMQGSMFRLSEASYLNDTSEGTEIFDFLSVELSAHHGHGALAELFSEKPFIGSFVAEIKHDDLALWRMYAKENKEEANGCAITLNMKGFLAGLEEKIRSTGAERESLSDDEQRFRFYKVAYRERGKKNSFIIPGAPKDEEKTLNEHMQSLSEKVKDYRKTVDSAQDSHDLVELLNEIAYLFKSAEYQYEHELRLVLDGVGFKKLLNEERTPPKVYIQLLAVRPLIEKIIFGPKVERADEWAAAFYYSLTGDGYQPEVLISRLPFK